MTPKVPIRERGTTTPGIAVAHTFRRNTNTTSTTSAMATRSVSSTSAMDARMVVLRSIITDRSMAPGIEARSWGSSAFTRSTVAMMFAPGCRNMMMRTPGLPFAMPVVRRSSTESCTSATSERCTAAPWRWATISGRYCAARSSWSLALIFHAVVPFASSPLGRFALAAASAERTSPRPMPYLFKTVGSSSTRTPGSELPPTITWPIPSTCASFCCRMEEAASYIRLVSRVSEVSARMRIGASAGLTFR